MQKYTISEIKKLKNNIYIRDVKYGREIEYEPAFKLWAVYMRISHPELSAKTIFKIAGIDTDIINGRIPKRNLHNWCELYIKFGKDYFINLMDYTLYDIYLLKLSNNILYEISKYDDLIDEIREVRSYGNASYWPYL